MQLGLVNKVFKGRDDRVRVAEVKIGSSTFVSFGTQPRADGDSINLCFHMIYLK